MAEPVTDPGDPTIAVLIARLEVKFDGLQHTLVQQLAAITSVAHDHETRLRRVEDTLHGLATKRDLAQIEAVREAHATEVEERRERQAAERQRRVVAWLSVAVGVVSTAVAAVVSIVVSRF